MTESELKMHYEPSQRGELVSIWPQERISRDCFATLAMDLAAPFLADMGLCSSTHDLRFSIRLAIEREPDVLGVEGSTSEEITDWLERFASELRNSAPRTVREDFWRWVRDTYTLAPADRPNWEMYEMFFFQWSVEMRDGRDTAGCFRDGRSVYEAHHAFTRARRLDDRVTESRQYLLSTWDQKLLGLCRYSPSGVEVDFEVAFDPFAVVEATADRNYFQQFWDYLLPLLTNEEREALLLCLQRHYQKDIRLENLVAPAALTRSVR